MGVATILKDTRYPTIEGLLLAIFNKLDDDLAYIQDNLLMGEYSLSEIAEKIENLRDVILKPSIYMESANNNAGRFKVEIVETYRKVIEVWAEDEDAAYAEVDFKIEEGLIDIISDRDSCQYERELFVSEIKE